MIGELVREGRLDLDAPASAYWPEFAARGKDSIPVRWLLSHRAGLPATRRDLQLADIVNWDRMVQVLAEEEPLLSAGQGPRLPRTLTYGWLAGEIIRRVSGVGVEEFFAQRVVRPLQVEAWIGVPKEALHGWRSYTRRRHRQTSPRPRSKGGCPGRAGHDLGALPVEIAEPNAGFNSAEMRRAVIPGVRVSRPPKPSPRSGGTVSDAESIRLLNNEAIADMCREQSAGEPALSVPGPWPRWAPASCSPPNVASSPMTRSATTGWVAK